MLPTLGGRIQTRIFALAVFGGIWTLLITPILPTGASLGASYGATYTILLMVIVFGVLWELLYHFLMQFRWEKDWPTLFGLLLVIPEGLLTWFLVFKVLKPSDSATTATFVVHLVTTWFLIWAMANGPLRVIFIRWRFRGGEIIGWL